MAVSKIWVFAEADGEQAHDARRSSCSPRRASSADTVEAVYVGTDADAIAARLGEHGATKVFVVDPGDALPGRRRRGRDRGARRPSTRPTRSCSRRATTAATRSPACR